MCVRRRKGQNGNGWFEVSARYRIEHGAESFFEPLSEFVKTLFKVFDFLFDFPHLRNRGWTDVEVLSKK